MKLLTKKFSYLTGDAGLKSFDLDIYVSKTGEFYFKGDQVPPELLVLSGGSFDESRSDAKIYRTTRSRMSKNGEYTSAKIYRTPSLNSITSNIIQAIDQYEESLAKDTRTRVIAYRFELKGVKSPSVPIWDESLDESGEAVMSDPIFFSDDRSSYFREAKNTLTLSLEWKVLTRIEKTFQNKVKDAEIHYMDAEDHAARVDADDDRIISWTPERETWFRNVEDQMRNLMLRVESFMNLDQDEVALLIENNTTLASLPAPGEPGPQKKKGKRR